MPKNIEMSVLNSEGSYDVLYPATMSEIVNISNSICDIFEVNNGSTLDDILLILGLGAGKYGYRITLLNPDDTPAVGYTINGLTDRLGRTLITDEYGQCLGVSDSTSVSINVNSVPYIDMNTISNTAIESTGIITDYTLKLSLMDELALSSSINKKISPWIETFDVCIVGGGGGGGGWGRRQGGPTCGGGGGYVSNYLNISRNDSDLVFSCGGGGGRGGHYRNNSQEVNNGGDGGTTTVTYGEIRIEAQGGGGGGFTSVGIGNGNGGPAVEWNESPSRGNGTNGSGYKFEDSSLGIAGGGGGGGGISGKNYNDRTRGGSPYGGRGGTWDNSGATEINLNGIPPTGPGGGGGGGEASVDSIRVSNTGGYSGIGYFRFHHT